jgi:DNA-binding MarR family transcriptional regulator
MKTTATIQEIHDFRAALRCLVRKIRRELRDDNQCCGVGHIMSQVLLELENSEGCSLKDLGTALETDKAALSRAVELLVKDGLVSRKEHPSDRRTIVIGLTPAGCEKIAELNRYSDSKYRCLLQTIPAEEHEKLFHAIALLSGSLDGLAALSADCAAGCEEKT